MGPGVLLDAELGYTWFHDNEPDAADSATTSYSGLGRGHRFEVHVLSPIRSRATGIGRVNGLRGSGQPLPLSFRARAHIACSQRRLRFALLRTLAINSRTTAALRSTSRRPLTSRRQPVNYDTARAA